ncbi:uncharacterized protein LOC103281374 isoform X2 [Anolis carolinensis]|uniref:uncharacterized protein LOC103281374 isoform X2 n=1 Tax=Anolis carolinensis TaxID=28377 RepID=UPI002F2B3398
MADDDDNSIRIGHREAGSLARDLEATILEFLEPVNVTMCYDYDSMQIGQREAESISRDLPSAVLDLLEMENRLLQPLSSEGSISQEDMEPVAGALLSETSISQEYMEPVAGALLSETSISQEDVEPVRAWDTLEDVERDIEYDTSEDVTPEPSGVMPITTTEEAVSDRSKRHVVVVAEDSDDSSIEKIFEESLISSSEFAIEKVLGQSTADILTEAETEASKFATKLQGLDANLETEPHNIMTCEICQLFVRTVDRLLDKRDRLMNHYLPLTEEEICNLKIAVGELDDEVVDCQRESCLARINNLSGKLRQRAYMMTLSQLRVARRNTQESLCQLHQTIDLIGQVQQEACPESHQSYRKLSAITVEWTQRQSPMSSRDSMKKGSEESKKSTPRTSFVEELGSPLAQSSSIEKDKHPSVKICPNEKEEVEEVIDSYNDTGTPPIETQEEAPMPLLEMNSPEPTLPTMGDPLPKAPTPHTEQVHKDVANITISLPGCDDDGELASITPTEREVADSPVAQMESQALQMSRSLALNLQGTYENLLANLQDLPAHLQKKLYQTCQRMGELGSDFNSAQSFGDLSRNVLKKSFEVMAEAQGSLDELMEYALQSPQALLWLKDRLPVLEARTGEVQALCEDSLLPNEGEEFPPNMEMRNILQIQQTYDPTGCEDDTLSSKEEVAPPSHSQDLEDILETLHAYDPKGCEDDIPPKKENEEVQPSSKVEWNILETLQGYIPRLPDKGDVPSDEKEETPPSTNEVEEERETDILKLQQAHDPKCYEDGAPSGEEVQVATSPSQTEWKDIIEIQQDYDPKGCVEAPRLSTSEEASSGQLGDWNILTTLQSLQAYVPKISSEKAPPAEEKNEVVEEKVVEEEEDLERDILKTQKAYDPKCYEDGAPSGEEVQVATSPSQTEWKDIIEIQQDYDPKGCVEAPRLSTSEEASSGQLGDWNILTTLQSLQAYVPKISSEKAPPAEEKNEVVEEKEVEEEEEDLERDILKTQKAHDPKCYEDGMPSGEEVEVATSPSQTEWKDIIEIQQDYDPKGCVEAPRLSTSEAASSGQLGDWNILTTLQSLQAYVPKISSEKAPPAEEKNEVLEQKEEGKEEKEEDLERDILKTQKAHDPKCYEDGMPSGEEVEVATSPSQTEWKDIIEIQQDYDPKGCVEAPRVSTSEVASSGQLGDWNILTTLQSLQAYVPKICPEKAPPAEGKKEMVEEKEVEKEEDLERDILETQKAHDSKGCKEEVAVQTSSRWESTNILQMQAMYEPRDCKEGAPLSEEVVVPSSGKQDSEDILKILQAYDPRACDEEPPPRKEGETPPSNQEEWNVLKMLQAYVPKSCPFEVPSFKEKTPEVEPSKKQVVKEKSILKNHLANNSGVSSERIEMGNILKMAMYSPKDCEEGAPSRKEGEEAVRPSGKAKTEDILKIQRAYDPMGCEDEAPSWKERRESQTSGKQEEWNIMKFFQSYIPKSRSEEPSAATIVEVKAEGAAASPTSKQDVKPVPPAPSKREVKEAMTPARKWDIQEWDILKIQEAYDPQGCKEDDR